MERLLELGLDGLARGQLTSCEAELQELMRQIDVMVGQRKQEWERELQALSARLEVREQELFLCRSTLERKHQEVGMLKQQLETAETSHAAVAQRYEEELKYCKDQLGKLKGSYEKLQRHQRRQASRIRQDTDGSLASAELGHLCQKLEEFRSQSLEWEKQRIMHQEQVAHLESQRRALAEECTAIQQQSLNYQAQLICWQNSVEEKDQCAMSLLQSQLEKASKVLQSDRSAVQQLGEDQHEAEAACGPEAENRQHLREELHRTCQHDRREGSAVSVGQLELENRQLRSELAALCSAAAVLSHHVPEMERCEERSVKEQRTKSEGDMHGPHGRLGGAEKPLQFNIQRLFSPPDGGEQGHPVSELKAAESAGSRHATAVDAAPLAASFEPLPYPRTLSDDELVDSFASVNEPGRLFHTMKTRDLDLLISDEPAGSDAAVEQFLEEESKRAKDLERLVEEHMDGLRRETRLALEHLGQAHGSPA
ncbi:centrosomal protein of 63 kDa-like isoform X1 [Lethenteron reissneri]|uniref:centrosomal protein of 63 kDa-like isoform X1 n=1 Tax=Lethenteron reissneri TaxID=7753 RepID=UPI002AB7E2DC|nr:centrosomal protein of 63 kDa-like isoform X1 [Lethenteron reissneri]XP_061426354.1 centrosomal protein of 63 kDa-like isoform X1 [Lethenteron reissneri]XP_061426355.1 centrosomal protein of 63 kDa-like isoform X1 [Lethenteron reissneri]